MSTRPPRSLVVYDAAPIAQFLIAGDIDRDIGEELVTALAWIAATDPQIRCVEVDVALVELFDSPGLKALLSAAMWAAKQHVLVYLVQVGPQLQRALDKAGLGQILGPP